MGERLGSWTWTRDKDPGVPNSGWPGSMSRIATLGDVHFFCCLPPLATSLVTSRFASSRENVDFPEDLGPQTKRTCCPGFGVPFLGETSSAISLYHSGGAVRSRDDNGSSSDV